MFVYTISHLFQNLHNARLTRSWYVFSSYDSYDVENVNICCLMALPYSICICVYVLNSSVSFNYL